MALYSQPDSVDMRFAPWKKGERFERKYTLRIPANPNDIFPLLCPEKEYLWLNDWKCTMVYSESGLAENQAVFYQNSGFPFYKRLTWYVTTYMPNKKIEFLININKVGSIKFNIDLIPIDKQQTELVWTFLITSHGKFGTTIFKKEFSDDRFSKDISEREKDLIYWIQNSTKRKRK
jgi:hypothetical protein